MEPTEKSRGGRPPTGRTFPHKVFGYVTDEELRLLERLEQKTNGSGRPRGRAGTIREAIRALAEKEGVR